MGADRHSHVVCVPSLRRRFSLAVPFVEIEVPVDARAERLTPVIGPGRGSEAKKP